jgi:hypothetical protein
MIWFSADSAPVQSGVCSYPQRGDNLELMRNDPLSWFACLSASQNGLEAMPVAIAAAIRRERFC